MWNEHKQRLFDELRERKQGGDLTVEELAQLEQLSEELDLEDEAYLRPAFEHSRQSQKQLDDEIAQKQERNAVLAALAERQAQLLKHAQSQLETLRHEQALLDRDYERIMGESLRAA